MSGAPTPQAGKGKGAFRRSQATEPGRSADALFDADRTTTVACTVHGCHAVRQPGDTKAERCDVDLAREAWEWVRRPERCLNTIRPEHTEIPY